MLLHPGLSFQVICRVKSSVWFGVADTWRGHEAGQRMDGLEVELLEYTIGS